MTIAMTRFQKLLEILFPKSSRYIRGEAVLFEGTNEIMIVDSVRRNGKSFSVECSWFAKDRRRKVWALFDESELRPLDWYKSDSMRINHTVNPTAEGPA
jgi:hypothetical protein